MKTAGEFLPQMGVEFVKAFSTSVEMIMYFFILYSIYAMLH